MIERLIILSIALVSICCENRHNNDYDICEDIYLSTNRYFRGTINDTIDIFSNDSLPNMVGSIWTYHQFEDDSIYLDLGITYTFDSIGSHHELRLYFAKQVGINEIDTMGKPFSMNYIYKDFKNYFSTGSKLHFTYLINHLPKEGVWIEYISNDITYCNNYMKYKNITDFDFFIDSTRYYEFLDCRNQNQQHFYISGKFYCKLINEDDNFDTLSIKDAKFKGYVFQSYFTE